MSTKVCCCFRSWPTGNRDNSRAGCLPLFSPSSYIAVAARSHCALVSVSMYCIARTSIAAALRPLATRSIPKRGALTRLGQTFDVTTSLYGQSARFSGPKAIQAALFHQTTIQRVRPLSGQLTCISASKSLTHNARFQSLLSRRFNGTGSSGKDGNNGKQKKEKKQGKLLQMMAMYGRLAVIAYLGVSVIDYSCCFVIVKAAGAEQVSKMEAWLEKHLGKYGLLPSSFGGRNKRVKDEAETEAERTASASELAELSKGEQAPTLVTVALVAYGIHKLLTPIRAALTAALLPTLARRFGHIAWLVGKRAAASAAASSAWLVMHQHHPQSTVEQETQYNLD
jgi:hypothetical protein